MSTVSIILPYYKKREFIKESLNSIINQSYKDFEVLLIYDDGSSEDLDYIKNLIISDNSHPMMESKDDTGH